MNANSSPAPGPASPRSKLEILPAGAAPIATTIVLFVVVSALLLFVAFG